MVAISTSLLLDIFICTSTIYLQSIFSFMSRRKFIFPYWYFSAFLSFFFFTLLKEAKWIDFCPESPSLSHFSRSFFFIFSLFSDVEKEIERARIWDGESVYAEGKNKENDSSLPLNNITTHIISYTAQYRTV